MAYTGVSIVDYLKSEGQDSGFSARKKLAEQMGIRNYTGTAAQNTSLLNMLRKGGTAAPANTGGAAPSAAANHGAGGAADPNAVQNKPQYAPSSTLQQMQQELAQKQSEKQAEYQSPYREQIEALLAQALEKQNFSYDPYSDPLYLQYQSAFTRGGRQAMEDTMANAAALTGGYGSSYASTAGNQAYQSYMTELNDVIPALYQSAYDRYKDSYGDVLSQLGVLQDLDAKEYDKYRDAVADYYADLNYYYKQYGDLSEREYRQYLTDLEQWAADRDQQYRRQQDAQKQANWEAEFALAQAKQASASSGGKASGGTSSAKSANKGASASQGEEQGLSREAQTVFSEALTIRDAASRKAHLEAALKKGRITEAEAAYILRQL